MTYLAGQDGGTTVIWIAETIREEHRAAIDWLNANTIESFSFFAVEVEALRIDDSSGAELVLNDDLSFDVAGEYVDGKVTDRDFGSLKLKLAKTERFRQ
jgi:hypothetical protein